MRLRKALVFGIAVLVVAMFMASCGEKEEEEAKTVTIGLTAPLSGVGAGYGEDIKAGLDMAIKKINDSGGVTIGDAKYKFKLNAADDQAAPEAALSNVTRFILQEGINIVWDPYATTITKLMEINNKPGEEFLIMSYTSIPLYATAPNPLMVTFPPPFTVYLKSFTSIAMSRGWKKMGMLQTTGSYGDLWGSKFEQAWTTAGGTVVAKSPANYYETNDFTPYLTTVLAANPDVIFCGGPSEPTGLVIEQARGLGFKGGFIVMDQAKLDVIAEKIGMEKLEGAIGTLPVELSAENWPYMAKFAEDYKAAYGKTVTWETAICYTGFHVLVEAMKKAGSVDDIKAIRAAFPEAAFTSGKEFPVEYSGMNKDTGAMYMPGNSTQVKDGQFTIEGEVRWWEQ